MANKKIAVVIPAYKAHKTIQRALASIACQTLANDVEVTVVNDDPNGATYKRQLAPFKNILDVREIRCEENGGPGVARQIGIDETKAPFITCMDADDTFVGSLALEILMAGITEPIRTPMGEIKDGFKCVSAQFMQLGEDLKHMTPHMNDMVWMFGKLYRRDFLEKYKIRFNTTRANEDTGFNMKVRLLCDNPSEQIRYAPELVYYWHYKQDSITRINNGQYEFDQCFCGWTDNMIEALHHAREYRSFSEQVSRSTAEIMVRLYFYYVRCHEKMPVFEKQDWEYVKKYYHECYKKYDNDISEKALSDIYSAQCVGEYGTGQMLGVMPFIGIHEFMDKLRNEDYNENDIKDIWKEMREDPKTRKLMENNEKCGVVPEGY